MTELYKVLYNYDTDKEDELAVKQGETIKITNKESSPDWWLAERLNNSKEYGLVPSNFLEKVQGMKLAIVTRDYSAQNADELSLQKDSVVTVLEQHDGVWKGDLNGKTGMFPADCVHLVSDDELKEKKDPFKLAAYGVKQGGIGSILAGGFNLKRTSTNSRTSINETTAANSSSTPVIPSKPHPSLIKPKDGSSNKKAMVVHNYNPENEDEINLMRGEYVTITDQLENDGWWKGINERGSTGVFPSNYVQIIEEETPPPRPTRTRPATVKSETEQEKPRAPPVPVGTRPSSLMTKNLSSSAVPPPRPITTPPPRPTTSPPIPTRRSVMGHKRIPSIPLMSPDLPPTSPIHERPTRSLPRPMSIDNQEAIQHMAKPPKVTFPIAPPRSRPVSENKSEPVAPKRSMPPTPTSALPSIPNTTKNNDDSLATEILHLIHKETEKIRKDFEQKLETERIERLKLQVELEELKKQLYQ